MAEKTPPRRIPQWRSPRATAGSGPTGTSPRRRRPGTTQSSRFGNLPVRRAQPKKSGTIADALGSLPRGTTSKRKGKRGALTGALASLPVAGGKTKGKAGGRTKAKPAVAFVAAGAGALLGGRQLRKRRDSDGSSSDSPSTDAGPSAAPAAGAPATTSSPNIPHQPDRSE